jgi:uncharacterized YigZ family protein
MVEVYKIVYKGAMEELVAKKSKFIATVLPIETEEAAITFVEKTRKKYWDAAHNCFAYVVGTYNEIQRCSDDGEPSGTAGKSILDVILGEEIHNVVVVVTRYFGGTLLGTGGLVRAYSNATRIGIEKSIIVNKYLGKKFCIRTDYSGLGKLQYIIGQLHLISVETEYTDIVQSIVIAPINKADYFEKKVIEATSGMAKIELIDKIYYIQVMGELTIFQEEQCGN